MVDGPVVELGLFSVAPEAFDQAYPEVGAEYDRDGVTYEVTLVRDEGGFVGGWRQIRVFGKEK